MTIQYSANPQAMGNVRAGRASFHKGSRSPEDVLRDHKAWNRGAAAEIHFRNGYWEAAAAAGMPRHDQLVATSLVDPCTAPR